MALKQFMTMLLAAAALAMPPFAHADEPVSIRLTIKDHKFEPAEIKAPAGKAVAITLKNEEIRSKSLIARPFTPKRSLQKGERLQSGLSRFPRMVSLQGGVS